MNFNVGHELSVQIRTKCNNIMFRFDSVFPAFSNAQLENDVCKLLHMLLKVSLYRILTRRLNSITETINVIYFTRIRIMYNTIWRKPWHINDRSVCRLRRGYWFYVIRITRYALIASNNKCMQSVYCQEIPIR